MGIQKLCACDRTRQNLISVDVDFIDTVKRPFAELVHDLCDVSQTGLWLNPFRGFPKGPRLSRFDVVYLDDDCRVINSIENFSEIEFRVLDREAASALVLPAHTLTSVQIQSGDQLRICRAGNILAGGTDSCDQGEFHVNEIRCIRELMACDAGSRSPKAEKQLQASIPWMETGNERQKKRSVKLRILRWLFPEKGSPIDPRRGERIPDPGLMAYYWTGGAPTAYRLGNVSLSGMYLLTEERWLPGTRIVMTLQTESSEESKSEDISRVESKVVRWGQDGVGFEFVETGFFDLNTGEIVEGKRFEREVFQQFLHRAAKPAPAEQVAATRD